MSGAVARIVAQAKLNLHLRVLAREPSGFHGIQTIFHRIDLGDDILIRATDGRRSIDVEGSDTGPREANLAFRAAAAYAYRSGWPPGFDIELTKRIPVGSGMGGGSADAAAVLRALESLAPNPMGAHILAGIAGSLGSDVPFLAGNAVMAIGTGRGEQLVALPALPRRDILLMTPGFSIATAAAYSWLDDDRAEGEALLAKDFDASALGSMQAPYRPGLPLVAADDFETVFAVKHSQLQSWEKLATWASNDFEPVIVARHPELGEMLSRLRHSRAIFSGMTGSGSTIFGILDGPADFAKVPAEHRHRVRSTMSAIDVVQPIRIE